MQLKTATGKIFNVQWADVATFDGIFRAEFTSVSLQEVLAVCVDPMETSTLTRIIDGFTTVFNGYTKLKTLDVQSNGNIVVAMERSRA